MATELLDSQTVSNKFNNYNIENISDLIENHNENSITLPIYYQSSDEDQLTQNLNYIDKLNTFKKKSANNFTILHLNINSIYKKIDELDRLIKHNLDIITLNETKLDDSIPNTFYNNISYNQIRSDRNRNGGGMLILIKNSY